MATLQNQLPTIGEMDELIGIGSIAEVIDDAGAVEVTYPTLTPAIRAKIRYVRTEEKEDQKQEKFVQEIKIWIRHKSDLTIDDVVYWDSVYWDIYALEHTPRKRFHVIKCRQIAE